MRGRALAVAVVAFALAAALASARVESVKVSAKIVKQGGRTELVVKNTGTEPIRELVFQPKGYDVTKVGWDGCRVAKGDVVCDNFDKYGYAIQPGQSLDVTLTGTSPANATGGGVMYANGVGPFTVVGLVSDDGGADLGVEFTGGTRVIALALEGKRSKRLSYVMVVTNYGPASTAARLRVQAGVVSGGSWDSLQASPVVLSGGCTAKGVLTVSCSWADLGPGESKTVRLALTLDPRARGKDQLVDDWIVVHGSGNYLRIDADVKGSAADRPNEHPNRDEFRTDVESR